MCLNNLYNYGRIPTLPIWALAEKVHRTWGHQIFLFRPVLEWEWRNCCCQSQKRDQSRRKIALRTFFHGYVRRMFLQFEGFNYCNGAHEGKMAITLNFCHNVDPSTLVGDENSWPEFNNYTFKFGGEAPAWFSRWGVSPVFVIMTHDDACSYLHRVNST